MSNVILDKANELLGNKSYVEIKTDYKHKYDWLYEEESFQVLKKVNIEIGVCPGEEPVFFIKKK